MSYYFISVTGEVNHHKVPTYLGLKVRSYSEIISNVPLFFYVELRYFNLYDVKVGNPCNPANLLL